MRATSNVEARGFGVLTITVSTDVTHYKARYIQELHLSKGHSVYNSGYLWSNSAGPLVWELSEV